jgi:hypothetical protein
MDKYHMNTGYQHLQLTLTNIRLVSADEPLGSLFVYFHIFAPLADDHVIVSHVTGITQPMLTFANDFRSFAMICDDFYLWAMLSTQCNPRSAPCDTVEVLWFSKTAAEDTSMSVYQNSKAVSVYRFSPMMRR